MNFMLATFINVILFLIVVGFFWLLPGFSFIKLKKIPGIEKFFLSLVFGFSLYTFLLFICRLIGLPFWFALLPLLFISFTEISDLRKKKFKLPKPTYYQKIFLVIAVIGALAQSLVLLRSGIETPSGLQFSQLSFHDSIWHVYLIGELKNNFPPRHGGFAPIPVKNYHFLLDLVLASLTKYLPFSIFELYYRIIPIFVSLFFSLSVFVTAKRLMKSERIAFIASFTALFSGNAAWYFQFVRGPEFSVSSDSFMLDSLTFMLHNPHAVVVFPLLLTGIIGLFHLQKKPDLRWSVLTALSFGLMIGFKAWGGTLVLASLPLTAFLMSLKFKRHDLWLVWLAACLISLFIFIPVYDPATAARPVFLPGWLLKRMVEDPNRYNLPKYFLLEQYYRETGNWMRIILINTQQVILYFFGNLWLRMLGLLSLGIYLIERFSPLTLFVSLVTAGSLILPLLFNQGRMAYEIIQYGPYGLVLLSIYTALVFDKLSKLFPKTTRTIVVVLLLLVSFPSNLQRLNDWIKDDIKIIPNEELQAYQYLKNIHERQAIILLYPSAENRQSAKIAALSEMPTFLSAKTFTIITGDDYGTREKQVIKFFNSVESEERIAFLKKNSIEYIFLTSEENQRVNFRGLNLEIVFSNRYANIYQVI